MDLKTIKAIIFDFDGTLYNGDVWRGWGEFAVEGVRYALKGVDENYINNLIEENNLRDNPHTYFINSLLDKRGQKRFKRYLKRNVYPLFVNDFQFIDTKFLSNLSKKCKLYIVSLSSKKQILYHLKKLKANQYFTKIYMAEDLSIDSGKKKYYEKIRKQNHLRTNELLVIGDHFKSDIQPAQELGFYFHQTKTLTDIYEIFKNVT